MHILYSLWDLAYDFLFIIIICEPTQLFYENIWFVVEVCFISFSFIWFFDMHALFK